MKFTNILNSSDFIFSEGSVIERLKRDYSIDTYENLGNAPMILEEKGKKILERIYRDYIETTLEKNIPFIILTPTWLANYEKIKNAGLEKESLNLRCYEFLDDIRNSYGDYSKKILIGGLIGCKGNAYNPEEALPSDEAYEFHFPQISELSNAGVDFLIASTLPALSEALGIAKVMQSTNHPFILSFVVRPSGNLLDGSRIIEAFQQIDRHINSNSAYFMFNCVHPVNLDSALSDYNCYPDNITSRILGLQANASLKSPEELEDLENLDSEDPGRWADQMLSVGRKYQLKILGGCCGTDERHIREMVINI